MGAFGDFGGEMGALGEAHAIQLGRDQQIGANLKPKTINLRRAKKFGEKEDAELNKPRAVSCPCAAPPHCASWPLSHWAHAADRAHPEHWAHPLITHKNSIV